MFCARSACPHAGIEYDSTFGLQITFAVVHVMSIVIMASAIIITTIICIVVVALQHYF